MKSTPNEVRAALRYIQASATTGLAELEASTTKTRDHIVVKIALEVMHASEAIVDAPSRHQTLPVEGWLVAYRTVTEDRLSRVVRALSFYPPTPYLIHLFIAELRSPATSQASESSRRVATGYLRELPERDIERFILPLLKDIDPKVRMRALEVLHSEQRLDIPGLDSVLNATDDGIENQQLTFLVGRVRESQATPASLPEAEAIELMWNRYDFDVLLSRRRIACRSQEVHQRLTAIATRVDAPASQVADDPRPRAKRALHDRQLYCERPAS